MKTRTNLAACALMGSGCLFAGFTASGCHSAVQSQRPSPPTATGQSAARQARDKQAQQYILKRREIARKTRRTHTSH